jgi:phenylacetate-CoA ligase
MDLTPGSCDCGNQNPVIRSVLGREQDYVVSPTRGMVGVGLIDIFKKLPPVVKQAQIAQDAIDRLVVRLVIDQARFHEGYLEVLREGIVERVGNEMKIEFELVERIEPEAGGKIRYIKRNPTLRWPSAGPPDE